MRGTQSARRVVNHLLAVAASTAFAITTPNLFAQAATEQKPVLRASAPVGTVTDWSAELWAAAKSGDESAFISLLGRFDGDHAEAGTIQSAASQLRGHIAKREELRTERIAEVRKELVKALEKQGDTLSLSKALRSAIELHVLTPESGKADVLNDPQIKALVATCDTLGRDAEAQGDFLTAGEMFVLLDTLLDVSGKYKNDVRRIGQRQELLRLYIPERLWELRNERQKKVNAALLADDPAAKVLDLPPYNAFGDDWRDKLGQVDQTMVERSLMYSRRHIEQKPMGDLLAGGLDALVTMSTTQDLRLAFDGIGNKAARDEFTSFLQREKTALADRQMVDSVQVQQLIDRVRRKNMNTVKITDTALLHEFGNGAMARLDEFSEIIWPDEVRRFQKNTQGRFIGVGIQIQYDDLQNIMVATPLEGTPAQRAGVHPKDLITKVDGRAVYGLSLDQVVDIITGREGTDVTLTLERKIDPPENAAEGAPPKVETLDVTLKRSVIKVATVKGWERSGVEEDSWNWFIDQEAKIGYVRLTQFADTTGAELDRAIAQMKKTGLKGIVLDLRFNPGGLLDQAVRISRRFIDVESGLIVMTQEPGGRITSPEYTEPAQASLAKMPLVVLINEGSASASEIVSGAISTYARDGHVDAVVLGARSYGKGSVQNVWPITSAALKVTTAYYMLPDKSIIHRRPGAERWGVEPSLHVEMLPKQTIEAITIRRDADIVAMDENGAAKKAAAARPEITDLITKGTDLQLEAALLLLRAKTGAAQVAQAAMPAETKTP